MSEGGKKIAGIGGLRTGENRFLLQLTIIMAAIKAILQEYFMPEHVQHR